METCLNLDYIHFSGQLSCERVSCSSEAPFPCRQTNKRVSMPHSSSWSIMHINLITFTNIFSYCLDRASEHSVCLLTEWLQWLQQHKKRCTQQESCNMATVTFIRACAAVYTCMYRCTCTESDGWFWHWKVLPNMVKMTYYWLRSKLYR